MMTMIIADSLSKSMALCVYVHGNGVVESSRVTFSVVNGWQSNICMFMMWYEILAGNQRPCFITRFVIRIFYFV